MFADRNATAMIPAKDMARAISWYEQKLGLKPARSDEYGASYEFTGVRAFLYQTQFAGTAQHTLLSFNSADLLADMAMMRKNGVIFEDYDLPGLQTENGVSSCGPVRNAWARDSEGNILGFVEGM